jgi:hypothetical protein
VTQTRFELDEYTLRVLDVVKGKYGLKNRNEALKKFVDEYGEKYVDKDETYEISDEIIEHFDNIVKEHKLKYKNNNKEKMTIDKMNKLLGLDE